MMIHRWSGFSPTPQYARLQKLQEPSSVSCGIQTARTMRPTEGGIFEYGKHCLGLDEALRLQGVWLYQLNSGAAGGLDAIGSLIGNVTGPSAPLGDSMLLWDLTIICWPYTRNRCSHAAFSSYTKSYDQIEGWPTSATSGSRCPLVGRWLSCTALTGLPCSASSCSASREPNLPFRGDFLGQQWANEMSRCHIAHRHYELWAVL
jgi:hypothetical protein